MTPGERAVEAIRQARIALADPAKARYHERLRVAIDRMQTELDWWATLGTEMRDVEETSRRVSLLACPHNVPNFGPPCPICDED